MVFLFDFFIQMERGDHKKRTICQKDICCDFLRYPFWAGFTKFTKVVTKTMCHLAVDARLGGLLLLLLPFELDPGLPVFGRLPDALLGVLELRPDRGRCLPFLTGNVDMSSSKPEEGVGR